MTPMTPQERRKIRLENDFKEMTNIKGSVIDWNVLKGVAPHVESYEIIVNIRTIIDPSPRYRNQHDLVLELPENYPNTPPLVNMSSVPPPYHPNWYRNGNWCYGTWSLSEGLGHYVIRLIRTLQFDLEITNPESPANRDANQWFLSKKNSGLFPCDKTALPDPTHSKFRIQRSVHKKFNIQNN